MTRIDELIRALADRYRIERELGAGGMATVYLARDLKHDRDVALKSSALSSPRRSARSASSPKSGSRPDSTIPTFSR